MEEEELEEDRRVVKEAEVEETGARSAPGKVTLKKGMVGQRKERQIQNKNC